MGDFNMYHSLEIRIKNNSYSKIINNLPYMYAINMILLFKRGGD
jgi:hypothetical protein